MSLGFGPWDDAFRYDVAFAYRPNARTESAPGDDGDGDGDGTRREGSVRGDERSGLFEIDRALARARRPWVREVGADAEEDGEANRRVDSPPSADSDVERVDDDAAATTPAEDTKGDEDVGQSQESATRVGEGDEDEAEAGGFLREDVRRGW